MWLCTDKFHPAGSTELLTDPQILTHPSVLCFCSVTHYTHDVALFRSVSEGEDIFGEGNIEKAVGLFEEQHVCNYYCRWPGFGLNSFAHKSTTGP
jgi:hypothetical protein